MPTQSEINQFRRLIGDYGTNSVSDLEVTVYLDDAAREASANDPQVAMVTTFDEHDAFAKSEAVYLAAINWWWDTAAKLTEKHSKTIGAASQNVGEKWDRAIEMIRQLTERLNKIRESSGGNSVLQGNLSRFSKKTLTRLGGLREEDTDARY